MKVGEYEARQEEEEEEEKGEEAAVRERERMESGMLACLLLLLLFGFCLRERAKHNTINIQYNEFNNYVLCCRI